MSRVRIRQCALCYGLEGATGLHHKMGCPTVTSGFEEVEYILEIPPLPLTEKLISSPSVGISE
jgi:hypothetical protein